MDKIDRRITKGIQEINKKNPIVCLMLWEIYDSMGAAKKEDLQVFELTIGFDLRGGLIQQIEYTQGGAEYKKVYKYYTYMPIEAKIEVINLDICDLMLLSSEYSEKGL